MEKQKSVDCKYTKLDRYYVRLEDWMKMSEDVQKAMLAARRRVIYLDADKLGVVVELENFG